MQPRFPSARARGGTIQTADGRRPTRGEVVDEPADVRDIWRDDLVAFLIGCSFTFERALLAAGLPVRHIEQRTNVPIYTTALACHSAGRFAGPLVVSMRPMTPRQASRVDVVNDARLCTRALVQGMPTRATPLARGCVAEPSCAEGPATHPQRRANSNSASLFETGQGGRESIKPINAGPAVRTVTVSRDPAPTPQLVERLI